jgi:hypothetical protein
MKASSKIIAYTEEAQSAKNKARSGGVGSSGGSSVKGGGACAQASGMGAPATSATHPEPAGEVGKLENEVIIGSDVAFAMIEGPSSSCSPRYRWWIGRVSKLFKGKHQYRHSLLLDKELPHEMSVVCEWYSSVNGADRCKFNFRQLNDRAKYSFDHFIGLVRIDLVTTTITTTTTTTTSSSSSGDVQGTYSISIEQRNFVDEALKLATPVHRGSKMTVAEKKRNEQLQQEERQEEE